MHTAYLIDAWRTPIGKRGGVFAHHRPDSLLIDCMVALATRHKQIDPRRIDDVVIGCAMPEAEQGLNLARQALVLAGLPESVPGLTVNRFCSSGLQSIAIAADRICLGEADLMLAGGVESMSLIPMVGNRPAIHPAVPGGEHRALGYSMGVTAEQVAQKYQINREDQDQFALTSHQRAITATDQRHFTDEILPIHTTKRTPNIQSGAIDEQRCTVDRDEGPRRNTSIEALAALKPVFDRTGTVTAGNASQMSDAAGLAVLASEQAVKDFSLQPLARYIRFSVAGVAPQYMGIGPVEALPKAIKQAGITLPQLEWVELNEAFAAQSLAVIRQLDLDPDKVNPCGGAIALGHPLGATGTLRTATLLHGLRRARTGQQDSSYGAVTMCIGQGMGAAGVFEVFASDKP